MRRPSLFRSFTFVLLLLSWVVLVLFSIQLHHLEVIADHSPSVLIGLPVADYSFQRGGGFPRRSTRSSTSLRNKNASTATTATATATATAKTTSDNTTTISSSIWNDPERAPIWKILGRAGYNVDDKVLFNDTIVKMLPKWSQIIELYGPPRILGMETCQDYRNQVPPKLRRIGVSGTFNSGTNILNDLLFQNCRNPVALQSQSQYSFDWQVPWGKHYPVTYRGTHSAGSQSVDYNVTNYLTVATIRDPYTWMQSMCRQSYGAQFDHAKSSCPNIVPYPSDIQAHPRYGKMDYMPVFVTYSKELHIKHSSLAHLWNEWYQPYVVNEEKENEIEDNDEDKNKNKNNSSRTSFPRLMVRLEDVIFHADTLIPQICACFGGASPKHIVHHKDVSNQNIGIETKGVLVGLLGSIVKYGNPAYRRKGYPDFQLQAAKLLLDPHLMNLFGYPIAEPLEKEDNDR